MTFFSECVNFFKKKAKVCDYMWVFFSSHAHRVSTRKIFRLRLKRGTRTTWVIRKT